MHDPDLTVYERSLLWDAIEGTYVIELRNGSDNLPSLDPADHRRRVAQALVHLARGGYIHAYTAPWGPDTDSTTRTLSPEELEQRLSTEEGWSPDEDLLVAFEATPRGRRVHLPDGAEE